VSVRRNSYRTIEHHLMPLLFIVHLRNIDAGELEIIQFGLPFGTITNILNLRKKNQVRWIRVKIDRVHSCYIRCLIIVLTRHSYNSRTLNMHKQWQIIFHWRRLYSMVDRYLFNFLIIKNWRPIHIMRTINKHNWHYNRQWFCKRSDERAASIVFFVLLLVKWSIRWLSKHFIK
jgi:hypothetical protein